MTTRIVCDNSTSIWPSARTQWKIDNRRARLAWKLGAGIATEKQLAGWKGATAARRSWFMLEDIHAEIAPKIAALRQSQAILEATGNLDNLSR